MRIFKEEQAFRQWWFIAILALTMVGCIIPMVKNYQLHGTATAEFFGLGLVLLIILLFWVLRLHTKIDAKGISARFEAFSFFRKEFKWSEINECYVRKYSPWTEYGGWGIRVSRKKKAYNVSGNIGIQIITKDKKKFLIGTNKPEEAKKVIRRYQEKLNQK
ncbi:hypothetical protein C8P64_2722 [Christiangramia gaetbulicola]|uniref:PH (Pleckstrin Homology) domain-containing protein n=1 Tax=Christiangramia gaetbulicola TaxID=703340 RepID=A0A2T6AEQ7_9FLAO|nr:hypothetical protein [Christiangramia gaetbulicola]PTX42294.1 hypothetical protein C8P64_2722 [Christiangramia gaetbulicola]